MVTELVDITYKKEYLRYNNSKHSCELKDSEIYRERRDVARSRKKRIE